MSSTSSWVEALVFVVPLLFSESMLSEKSASFVSSKRLKEKRKNDGILPVGTLGRHANGLSAGICRLEEVAQLLFEDVQALRACCVRHAEDWSPEVEGVGNVGADTHED